MTDYRAKYQRLYSTEHRVHDHGSPPIVPENVERVADSAPCFLCGQARGCRHRWAA